MKIEEIPIMGSRVPEQVLSNLYKHMYFGRKLIRLSYKVWYKQMVYRVRSYNQKLMLLSQLLTVNDTVHVDVLVVRFQVYKTL